MRNWNSGQKQAISARRSRLLVSASAGTGKTAVLVERLLGRLTDREDPLEMDRFLMVTFTNAAAQEMRQRIHQRLDQLLAEAKGEAKLWARRQQLLLGRASISTLHAFCLELIRQNYQLLKLDPQSKILNEAEQILLKQQVLEELLEERYAAGEPDFLSLAAAFGGEKNDRPLRELILRVYEFAISQPRPLAWLSGAAGIYKNREGTLPFLSALYGDLGKALKELGDRLAAAAKGCRSFEALKGYESRLAAEGAALTELGKAEDWDCLVQGLEKAGELFGRLPGVAAKPKKEEAPTEFEERLRVQAWSKEVRDQVKKAYKELREPLLGENIRRIREELALMAPAMTGLAAVTQDFILAYAKAKEERAAMDFADIEHQALLLLTDGQGRPTELAKTLQERYLEVLVDEYQDINPVQEEILQAIAGQSFFMVGDVKQSIYGFRQAAPELFLQKYHTFREKEEAWSLLKAQGRLTSREEREEPEEQAILLEENYRSSQVILEGINGLFDRLMQPELGGVDYRREGRFLCGSPRKAGALPFCRPDLGYGPLELHLIETKPEGPGETGAEEGEDPAALELEALFLAKRIRDLLKEEIWDEKAKLLRPVTYRDIAVLLPAMANVAEVFTETLQSRDIPVFADMGSGYFGAQEVETAVSFLKVVDNPRQDIPLAALLLSPVYGFTAAELAEIRLVKRSCRLYEALVLFGKKGRGSLGRRVRNWLRGLRQYRSLARRDSMEHLLLRFYQDTGFLTLAAAMPGGRQREANLQALIFRARQFEESNLEGLYQFIRYLDALNKSGTDLSAAAVIGENEDVVRIMSIHKSKGLEFPIVFLATCGRRFNQREACQDVLLHPRLGLASVVLEPKRRVKYPGAYHLAVSGELQKESLAEEQRLLYVALTRARERLILVAALQKAEEKLTVWQEAGPLKGSGQILQAKSFLDWLGPLISGQKTAAEKTGQGWQYRLWTSAELMPGLLPEEETRALWRAVVKEGGSLLPETPPAYRKIAEKLAWQYPYAAAGGAPAKLSVTQARGRLYPEEDPESAKARWLAPLEPFHYDPPAFVAGKTHQQSLVRGTALHKVLSRIEPAQVYALMEQATDPRQAALAAADYLQALTRQLTEHAFLTPQEQELFEAEPLLTFMQSALFRRAAAADALGLCRKETSFAIQVPARRLYPDLAAAGEDPVLIQGAIDLFFEEEGGMILVDYKTDRVEEGAQGEAKLVQNYRGQLKLYGEALARLTGKPVRQLLIYSLALGREVPVRD